MKVKFISLASGSSGNCYYIGTEKYGILIDAGIAVRTIKKSLKEVGVGMETIRAVFVTHDHADHIKAVGGLGEKLHIPVYTTARIHEGINKSYCMTEKLHSSVHYLEKEEPMVLEDFHIESFEVPTTVRTMWVIALKSTEKYSRSLPTLVKSPLLLPSLSVKRTT